MSGGKSFKRKALVVLASGALVGLLGACNYNELKGGTNPTEAGGLGDSQRPVVCETTGLDGQAVQLAQTIDFAAVNQAVFVPHCTRCHSTAGRDRGGVNLETYANVISWGREIQSAVGTDFMPPRAPLNPQLKSLLDQWFASGAPEFVAPPASGTPACAPTGGA